MSTEKRPLILIRASSAADFRAQFDAALAEAQRLNGVPILPADGDASEAALVQVLADVIERACVAPAVVQSSGRAKAA
jgi:hypothetical protein